MSVVAELKAALQRAARDVPAPGWTARLEYVTGTYGVVVHAERRGLTPSSFPPGTCCPCADAFDA